MVAVASGDRRSSQARAAAARQVMQPAPCVRRFTDLLRLRFWGERVRTDVRRKNRHSQPEADDKSQGQMEKACFPLEHLWFSLPGIYLLRCTRAASSQVKRTGRH